MGKLTRWGKGKREGNISKKKKKIGGRNRRREGRDTTRGRLKKEWASRAKRADVKERGERADSYKETVLSTKRGRKGKKR